MIEEFSSGYGNYLPVYTVVSAGLFTKKV